MLVKLSSDNENVVKNLVGVDSFANITYVRIELRFHSKYDF